MTSPLLGIRGWLIDTPEYGRLRSWSDGALIIENGRILEVGEYGSVSKKPRPEPVHWIHSNRFAVFPGLIDLHSHIPQYPAVARGHSELLPWLRQHIFPLEREFTGLKGRREAAAFFAELARQGTTTAVLYAAIYEDSCEAAFQAAAQSGLRIILGKMMMDVGSYGALQPNKIISISLHEAERLCRTWHGANDGLIEYAVSPRFAVSCSEKLLRGAADLAAKHGCYIQTHLAENREESEKIRHLFPAAQDYTGVYEQCGLLGPRTILGHAIHLCPRERDAISAAGAAVAHCPSANLFLRSGIMPLDQMRGAGIRVGLGSDVAAGPELNLWRVMRSAVESQKARAFYEPGVAVPSPAEALYLATQGAAEALGKERILGTFDVGKEADLTIVDYGALLPYRGSSKGNANLGAEDIVSLCVHRGGPEAVVETFVRGQSVYRAREPDLL
ncbi:MAG: amidohydrolase family protein [Verrucomicrobiota bacterium]|nr:amidohydrolase family protein [Verrucomicrobiota bacterium]